MQSLGLYMSLLTLQLDKDYRNFVQEIKARVKQVQLKASIAVNRELLQFYWDIGHRILEKQKTASWGDKLLDALAADLKKSFPDSQGFSKTNLKYMRMFAEAYPHFAIGQPVVDQLNWSQHVTLLLYAPSAEARDWYALKTITEGWSRRKLLEQIKAELYERYGKLSHKTTNFSQQLPAPQSELAQEMLKDPYKFDFLTLGKDAHEKEIEKGLISHITKFLLELGQGFAFLGNQFPIKVSDKKFTLDLLFYHVKLHCYFVVEIKRGEFKPAHTGQLNFYLSAVDEQLKQPQDNPTLGLLLCEKKDKVIAEYALRDINKPMGISEYQLAKALPEILQTSLPTVEDIEAELSKHE